MRALDHELPVPTTAFSRPEKLNFPEPLRHIDEILMLCHSSAVEESPPADRSNLVLIVAQPGAGLYQLYRQDWFNKASLDYRIKGSGVARDPPGASMAKEFASSLSCWTRH